MAKTGGSKPQKIRRWKVTYAKKGSRDGSTTIVEAPDVSSAKAETVRLTNCRLADIRKVEQKSI